MTKDIVSRCRLVLCVSWDVVDLTDVSFNAIDASALSFYFDLQESPENVRQLVKEKSVTMEYFLETSHLDSATAEMLKKYDRDGDGSFSKDEVVAIILDLREAMQSNEMLGQSNKLFKRLLVAALCFCVLLLTAMFGLSYAVAALTAKTDISGTGVMTTIDGKSVVATDSTAQMFVFERDEEMGVNCISQGDAEAVVDRVTNGRSVMLKIDKVNMTHTIYEHVSPSGLDVDAAKNSACFTQTDGRRICIEPVTECVPFARRRMQERSGMRFLEDSAVNYTACEEYMSSLAEESPDLLRDDITEKTSNECINECTMDCYNADFTFDPASTKLCDCYWEAANAGVDVGFGITFPTPSD